uniref:Uncharacterized protein n=1 Tax=Hyaloperonospora arabidopsidis (strain Emoy2) TaxID=559515 RepID=M4C6E7_HYAAE
MYCCSPFGLHAALPPVAHAAARRPPPFNLGPTIGDFPPRVRGPVARLFGGLRRLAVVARRRKLGSVLKRCEVEVEGVT